MKRFRYTSIHHEVREQFGLNANQYIVCDAIHRLSRRGPCEKSNKEIGDFVGLSKETVRDCKKVLEDRCVVLNNETSLAWDDAVVFAQGGAETTLTGRKPPAAGENRPHSITKNSNNISEIKISQPSKEKKEKLDLYGNPLEEVVKPPSKGNTPLKLLKVAEKRRGVKFANDGKQLTWIKKMIESGRTPKEIGLKWEELRDSSWWLDKGLEPDFLDVAKAFDRGL